MNTKFLIRIVILLKAILYCETKDKLNSFANYENKLQGKCIQNDSCSNNDQVSKIAYKDDTLYLKRDCYCDDNCFSYSDCCPDKIKMSQYKRPLQNLKCILEKRVCGGSKLSSYVYSIGECPVEYKEDEEIRSKCLKSNFIEQTSFMSENSNETDIFLQWPFYSNKTSITYNNLYCGLCNGENKTDLQPWNAAFRCAESVSKKISKLKVNEFYSRMDKVKENCVFVKWMSHYMQFRYCRRNMIDKCLISSNSSEENKLNNLKCSRGEYKIRISTNDENGQVLVFRNNYCAECSGLKADPLCMKGSSDNMIPDSKYRCDIIDVTWSVLFDFNFFTGEYRVGFNKHKSEFSLSKCDCDSFYDPFSKTCIQIAPKNKVEKYNNLENCTESIRVFQPEEYSFLHDNNDTSNRVFIIKENLILNQSFFKYDEVNGTVNVCFVFNSNLSIYQALSVEPEVNLEKFSDLHNILTIAGISLSLIGLTVLVLIYLSFPPLRNLPGKNLICLCISYILVYLIIIFSTFLMKYYEANDQLYLAYSKRSNESSTSFTKKYDFLFYSLAVLLNYAFLCSFSWMTIISFDICRTFIGTRYHSTSRSKEDENRLFIQNLLFGFCILPLIPIVLALIVDVFFHELPIAPHYGGIRQNFRITWFSNRFGLLVFYVLPVALMIFFNLIFFICTVISILKTDATTAISLENKSKSNFTSVHPKYRVILFVKLLILMGLSWVVAFMASLTDSNMIYILNTLINAFQGFFIFLSFTLNNKVLGLIKEKFCKNVDKNFLSKNSKTPFVSKASCQNFKNLKINT